MQNLPFLSEEKRIYLHRFSGEDTGLSLTHTELAPVPKSSPPTQLGPQGCCAPIGSQGRCWLLPLPFWILFCRWKYCKADVSIPLRAHPHACMDACTHTLAHTHAQSFAGAGLVLPKGPEEEEETGALPQGDGVAEPCGRFGQSSPIGWGQRLRRAPKFKLLGAADGWAVLREGINHQMCGREPSINQVKTSIKACARSCATAWLDQLELPLKGQLQPQPWRDSKLKWGLCTAAQARSSCCA